MPALTVVRRQDPAAVAELLRALPEWFGIAAATQHYIESAGYLTSYLACRGSNVLGCVLIREHLPAAAEVYLMAVHPAEHRQGIGRALLSTVEGDLHGSGVHWLQVKRLARLSTASLMRGPGSSTGRAGSSPSRSFPIYGITTTHVY